MADIRVAVGARLVAEVVSNPSGAFMVSLPPGTYVVTGTWTTAGRTVVSRRASVSVATGAIASVTVEFDTGIR